MKKLLKITSVAILMLFMTFSCTKKSSTPMPANGTVIFWINSSQSQLTVSINGQTGYVTEYYATSTPTCGAVGCATFSLPAGTYYFTANNGTTTYNNNGNPITITSNQCLTFRLQ